MKNLNILTAYPGTCSEALQREKKLKKLQSILKQKADALINDVNSQMWCPSTQGWWDDECRTKFEEVELLAAMWKIDLLKAPQNFGKLYPDILISS